jgi:hypothetical protein
MLRRTMEAQAAGLPGHTASTPSFPLRASWIVWTLAAAAAIIVLRRAIASYFFLFDDFALIGVAATQPLSTLLVAPLIGFYRPVGFAVLWASARLFGWDAPSSYLGVSLALHAMNAGLCALLARQLAFDRLSAAIAGLLFLLSPWATEGFLWVSGTFDVTATCGVLITMLCLRAATTTGARGPIARALLLIGAAMASLVAVFSKEGAIVLPAFALVWAILASPRDRGFAWRGPIAAIVVTGASTIVYLLVRSRMLGVFAGAYGEFGSLWARATVVSNLWSYVRHCLLPPMPTDGSTPAVFYHVGFVYPYLGAVLPALLWRGVGGRPRLVLGCAICFLIALAPVGWTGLAPNSTNSTRFLYLGGAWFALGLAAACGGLRDSIAAMPRRRSWLAPLALTLIAGYHLGSLAYQAAMWGRAAALSRSVMAQMEQYRNAPVGRLHILNLPQVAVEGPWISKGYAFRFYRGGVGMPPIRADLVLVRLSGGVATVAPLGADQFGDYPAGDGGTETDVTLQFGPAPR